MRSAIPDPLREKMHPRRAVEGSVPAVARNPIAALRKKIAKPYTYKKAIGKGVESSVQPELAPIRREAHALLGNLTADGIARASRDALAVLSHMVRQLDFKLSLVPALIEARGLVDTLSTQFAALGFIMDAASGGWTTEIHAIRGRRARPWHGDTWHALRQAVCAAPDDEYARARDEALALRETAELVDRVRFAFAFPDEPWADADLRACLADASIDVASYSSLLSACRDPALARECLARAPHALASHALDLAYALPADDAIAILSDAIPALLVKPKYGALAKTPPRDVLTALACFRARPAAERIAPYAGHAILGPIVAGYFQSAPELADVLASGATTKAGRDAASRILATKGASGDHGAAGAAEADPGDVPAVLRERPWRPRKGRAALGARVVEGVALPADVEERVALPPGARPFDGTARRPVRDMSEAELASYVRDRGKRRNAQADFVSRSIRNTTSWEYLRVPSDLGVRIWNEGNAYLHCGPLAFVATHGLAVLPGFLAMERLGHLDYEGADEHLTAIQCFESPRIAPLFARIAARRKKHRRVAYGWLERHVRLAALGLVPLAVGPHGPSRGEAEAALLHLVAQGESETIRAAAASVGRDAASVIDDLLARDPLALDAKPRKLPELLRLDDLPPVRIADGAVLPADSRDALVEMLSVVALDAPYPGIDRVRAACDERSLGSFAAALLEQWLLGGCPGRHEWMLHAIVWFPSEDATRRIALLAREWARKEKAKAVRACVVLAAIGTDLALLHLGHIADTSRFVDLREEARALLDGAAEMRGLTRDELEDRTVPDLGLGPDGTITVSFGARSFVASLDVTLALSLRDADGNRSSALPRKQKGDDPSIAKPALDRLKVLRDDAAAIASRQISRLERAMVRGRLFRGRDFRERIATHPVVMRLARGLVWESLASDGAARRFRIADDGMFADVEDEVTSLADDAAVRVAHPLAISEPERDQWSARFSDYEILQPFEQLGRTTYTCGPAERDASASKRVEGVVVEARRLLGSLESRGFERNDKGMVTSYLRRVESTDGVAVADLGLTPGIDIAYLASAGAQTLGELSLRRDAEPVAFGALTPVAFSELVRDLEALRG